METTTGIAAGVPFTALPPAGATDGPSPLIVTWHMLDAPRTDSAFAAALPMTGVPAWRVHLGMPMCGERMVDGRVDAAVELIRKDALMAYAAPFTFRDRLRRRRPRPVHIVVAHAADCAGHHKAPMPSSDFRVP